LYRGKRQDIEEEDEQESYFRWLEENPNAGVNQNDDDDEKDIDYDEDGNLIVPEKKKVLNYECINKNGVSINLRFLCGCFFFKQIIEPLPAVDHSQIDYAKFEKNFYQEHEEITNLGKGQVEELRNKLNIKVQWLFFF
jgi:ATP-dependent RNA helicase DDX42